MPKAKLKEMPDGSIVSVKKPLDIWPADKPVPEGMVRTKKGTLITLERAGWLQKARDNAEGKTGRPKARHTLLGEEMRARLVEKAHKMVDQMVDAQIDNAKGITVMIARKWETNRKGEEHRSGEFAQITDAAELVELLNGDCKGDNFYKIVTKSPNVEAFKILLEQSMGKPKEMSKEGGTVEPLAVIINNIQRENGSTSVVTVRPKQLTE